MQSNLFSTIKCNLLEHKLKCDFPSAGTFGQPEMWSIHIPSSWIHPGVPYEVLIDPLSMPHHDILKRKSHLSEAISSDVTPTDRGELKVNCNISKMITWALPFFVSFLLSHCIDDPSNFISYADNEGDLGAHFTQRNRSLAWIITISTEQTAPHMYCLFNTWLRLKEWIGIWRDCIFCFISDCVKKLTGIPTYHQTTLPWMPSGPWSNWIPVNHPDSLSGINPFISLMREL